MSIKNRLDDLGHSSDILPLVPLHLPLYTPEYKKENGIPVVLESVLDQLRQSTRLVFIAPEYNGGIPPILTNFLTWVSSATDDWRECFNGKKAAIATHSGGGGLHVLMALRLQLSYMGVNVLGRQLHTHYDKPLDDDVLNEVVEGLIN